MMQSPNPAEPVSSKENNRFKIGNNDIVIDTVKRLVWLKQDTWQMTGKWMNWVQLRDYSNELNQKKHAGYDGWRFPTVSEAQSLYNRSKKIKDHMGQMVAHEDIFEPGFGFLYWTSDLRNKIQAVRFGFRKGLQMFDDVYRTSRGSTRFVRDIEKEDGLI